ncbi:MAG: pyrimidine-nucleoside phosphorylase [Candidatus Melainabacteria bacterium GWF2_37_15]|nr:MAG: pyrimidine-nucleoside phosphorylase [Candidatus Melainabacteria bacterium GWF2_37_15]
MRMVDLINKKKCGEAHTQEEISFLINGMLDGTIPDYQLSAWLMSVCFQGMTFDESAILTMEMAKSGDMLDLSCLGDCIIDKHSTGGVGDKTTLIVVPLLAAAGCPVAKFSGRGLGFTGGTIDKLEAIPGFRTALSTEEFLSQIKNIGAAIASQTANFTPADKKMYELRDVTATVNSIPLIASSVVSKKIAAGANVIVLDVKCGSGAFMKTADEARELAKTMVEIGKRAGKTMCAVITSMDQPLGNTIGNGIEVAECVQVLKNEGPQDLKELCLYLSAMGLVKAKKARNINEGKNYLEKFLQNGKAYEKFVEIVKYQGGDVEYIENPQRLSETQFAFEVVAEEAGYVQSLDALTAAKAAKMLGTGRDKKDDPIDYRAGVLLNKKIGDKVYKGDILAKIFANSIEQGNKSREILVQAFKLSKNPTEPTPLVVDVIE